MAKKVRDTIHGYIYLTKLEEAVSQHPLVLRLHYVHQTSFTYLTYPNAHSTRYPHSLGVMHVAGDIFQSALLNSKPAVLRLVGQHVRNFIDSEPGAFSAIRSELSRQQDGASREPIYEGVKFGSGARASARLSTDLIEEVELYVCLTVLLQATRLAALLHDIGHPPFSHIVEFALLQARPGEYLGHEEAGKHLLDIIARTGSQNLKDRSAIKNFPKFSKMCLSLCKYILGAEKGDTFYLFKRSLLSGPLDADRLDYVRRDAYSAGLVPTYDIRRLVDAAFFRISENRGFEVGFRPNCLSSFENFFQARYDLYRYMIYHHDVARRNLAIQRVIVMILQDSCSLPSEVKGLGQDFFDHARGKAASKYDAYEYFVDAYLLNLLWRIDALVPRKRPTKDDKRLKLYLDVILRRRNDKLRTLIKRPDEYARLAQRVMAQLPPGKSADGKTALSPVPAFNRLLRKKLEQLMVLDDAPGTKPEKAVTGKGGKEDVAKLRLAVEMEAHLEAAMKNLHNGCDNKLHCYYVGTFNAGPKREVVFSEPTDVGDDSGRTVAEDISPAIAMLEAAWSFSPQLSIFFEMAPGTSDERAKAIRDTLWPVAVTGLANLLKNV